MEILKFEALVGDDGCSYQNISYGNLFKGNEKLYKISRNGLKLFGWWDFGNFA